MLAAAGPNPALSKVTGLRRRVTRIALARSDAEALQAICDLDLTELQAIVPPRGFGRD